MYDRIPSPHGLACQKRSLQLLLPTAYQVKGEKRTGFSITLFYLANGTHDTMGRAIQGRYAWETS